MESLFSSDRNISKNNYFFLNSTLLSFPFIVEMKLSEGRKIILVGPIIRTLISIFVLEHLANILHLFCAFFVQSSPIERIYGLEYRHR
jgi:hypothetical protein